MINYCLEYHDIESGESYTSIFDSRSGRDQAIQDLDNELSCKVVTEIYENEECYCHAYSENGCACGNFK